MKNPLASDSSSNLGLFLARVPLGVFFLIAGYTQISGGAKEFVSQLHSSVPRVMPADWGRIYHHFLPWLVVTVGAMLVLGLLTRLGGLLASLILVNVIVAVTGVTSGKLPFEFSVVYLGLALMTFFVGGGRFSLDGWLFAKRSSGKGRGHSDD